MTDVAPPPQFDISWEIKIDEYQKQCRKTLKMCMWEHNVSTSFADLQATIDETLQRELRNSVQNAVYVRSDACFYCKRTKSTKQSEYQKFTASNIQAVVNGSWSSHCRAQANRVLAQDPFQLVLVVYVTQPASNSLQRMHRATKSRISSATQTVRAFVAQNDVPGRVGEILQRYWTITHTRQSDGTPISVPTNCTFRQTQALDALRHEVQAREDPIGANADASEFYPIRIRGIGNGVTTLQLSVSDLRLALGLPSHNLLARGIFHSPSDDIGVPEDQLDVGHIDGDEHVCDSETL